MMVAREGVLDFDVDIEEEHEETPKDVKVVPDVFDINKDMTYEDR